MIFINIRLIHFPCVTSWLSVGFCSYQSRYGGCQYWHQLFDTTLGHLSCILGTTSWIEVIINTLLLRHTVLVIHEEIHRIITCIEDMIKLFTNWLKCVSQITLIENYPFIIWYLHVKAGNIQVTTESFSDIFDFIWNIKRRRYFYLLYLPNNQNKQHFFYALNAVQADKLKIFDNLSEPLGVL